MFPKSITATVLPAKSDSDATFCLKIYKGLYSIDHLCINSIHRIGLIHTCLSIRVSSSGVYMLKFYLTIVNKYYVIVTLGWHEGSGVCILHAYRITSEELQCTGNVTLALVCSGFFILHPYVCLAIFSKFHSQ